MTAADPLVSIVIPVFDGERYLAEAVRSVLAQDYRPIEILVVDDGSTDGTAAIARGFGDPVRYVHQANAGQATARNLGVELAGGELIAFLDADDYWSPGKLRRQTDLLAREPELEAVLGHVRQFYTPELAVELSQKVRFHAEIMPGHLPGTLLIRRGAFERIGPFDPQWRVGEFLQWYARATERGLRLRMLPDVLLHRRLHETNQGIRHRADSLQYVRILKAALDRRREVARADADGDPAGS